MAITKILHINEGKQHAGRHLYTAIRYITVPEKCGDGRYIGAINCLPDFAYEQMRDTKELFGKTDKRQAYHIIISFEEGEITADKAYQFMGRFVDEYLKGEYEAIYAIHDNTDHIHGHLIFNSVSKATGLKFRYKKGDWARFIQPVTNRLCEEYGLSTIDIVADRSRAETLDDMRILRVKIPYRLKRAKLSGLQRRYFRKLYEKGLLKKRPYSQAWKYRDAIREFKKLQSQYLFLADHEIHDIGDLKNTKDRLEQMRKEKDNEESVRLRREIRIAGELIREYEKEQDKEKDYKYIQEKKPKTR